jgi:hypothetical protein
MLTQLITSLANELKAVEGYAIKSTPLAAVAPHGYYALNANGEILVWYDSTPAYTEVRPRNEANVLRSGHHFKRHIRIVISVGQRNLTELPTLDTALEDIENLLTNLDIQGFSLLTPTSISKMTVDENKVYWRQIHFETKSRLEVAVHHLTEEE